MAERMRHEEAFTRSGAAQRLPESKLALVFVASLRRRGGRLYQ
jgi:hypothetical protein